MIKMRVLGLFFCVYEREREREKSKRTKEVLKLCTLYIPDCQKL